jgi:hypothetical protein
VSSPECFASTASLRGDGRREKVLSASRPLGQANAIRLYCGRLRRYALLIGTSEDQSNRGETACRRPGKVKMMDSSEILCRDLGEGCIDRIYYDRE